MLRRMSRLQFSSGKPSPLLTLVERFPGVMRWDLDYYIALRGLTYGVTCCFGATLEQP